MDGVYGMQSRLAPSGGVASLRSGLRHFGECGNSAGKPLRCQRQSGPLGPCALGLPPRRRKLVPYGMFLIQAIETKPDITMPEPTTRLWD